MSGCFQPGPLHLSGTSTTHTGATSPVAAALVLGAEGDKDEHGDVSGMLDGQPIINGSWTKQGMKLSVLYNASIVFEYALQQLQGSIVEGSFSCDDQRASVSHSTGTLRLVRDEAPSDAEAVADAEGVANEACAVRQTASIAVPCSACQSESATLSFFEMKVPHFGASELVSFSCAECHYKYSKMQVDRMMLLVLLLVMLLVLVLMYGCLCSR